MLRRAPRRRPSQDDRDPPRSTTPTAATQQQEHSLPQQPQQPQQPSQPQPQPQRPWPRQRRRVPDTNRTSHVSSQPGGVAPGPAAGQPALSHALQSSQPHPPQPPQSQPPRQLRRQRPFPQFQLDDPSEATDVPSLPSPPPSAPSVPSVWSATETSQDIERLVSNLSHQHLERDNPLDVDMSDDKDDDNPFRDFDGTDGDGNNNSGYGGIPSPQMHRPGLSSSRNVIVPVQTSVYMPPAASSPQLARPPDMMGYSQQMQQQQQQQIPRQPTLGSTPGNGIQQFGGGGDSDSHFGLEVDDDVESSSPAMAAAAAAAAAYAGISRNIRSPASQLPVLSPETLAQHAPIHHDVPSSGYDMQRWLDTSINIENDISLNNISYPHSVSHALQTSYFPQGITTTSGGVGGAPIQSVRNPTDLASPSPSPLPSVRPPAGAGHGALSRRQSQASMPPPTSGSIGGPTSVSRASSYANLHIISLARFLEGNLGDYEDLISPQSAASLAASAAGFTGDGNLPPPRPPVVDLQVDDSPETDEKQARLMSLVAEDLARTRELVRISEELGPQRQIGRRSRTGASGYAYVPISMALSVVSGSAGSGGTGAGGGGRDSSGAGASTVIDMQSAFTANALERHLEQASQSSQHEGGQGDEASSLRRASQSSAGIRKFCGPLRYRLSAEAASRCPNLVHSRPRMRRRRPAGTSTTAGSSAAGSATRGGDRTPAPVGSAGDSSRGDKGKERQHQQQPSPPQQPTDGLPTVPEAMRLDS